MSKTRKTLIIILLIVASLAVFISSFVKLEHWSNTVYLIFACGGFVLATTALVCTMARPKLK